MSEDIAARFARNTAQHTTTVLHDQGLYRHLSFCGPAPGSWAYWFELITVPYALIFRGDGESFVFSREKDMFAFFRSSAYGGEPNYGYWAEKLTDGATRAMRYSGDRFTEWVNERVSERADLHGLAEAVQRAIVEEVDTYSEDIARQWIADFRFFVDEDQRWALTQPDFEFEWPEGNAFHDYDWWFQWACHAIVWGIAQYDACKSVVAS